MASKPFFDARRREWCIKYKPDPAGPWKREKLCKHLGPVRPGVTPRPPEEAERRAREFAEIEYRAKHSFAPAPAKPKALAEFLAAHVEAHTLANVAGSTAHVKRGCDRFAAFAAARGVVAIQSVTQSVCRDYLEMRSRVVAVSTLKTERGYLSGAWTRAVEDGLIASNPWAGARVKGKATPSHPTFWTGAEIAGIAAACGRPWQSDLVLLMANTGLRISTALAMRWSWVGADHHLKLQRAPNVKTVYTHVLSAAARAILERRRAGAASPLVFPRDEGDEPNNYMTAKDALDRAIRKAGVRPGTPHDLRHSYGRALALAGVPITVIRSQMGHTSIAMTQRYMVTDATHAASFVEGLDLGGQP